MGLKDRLKARFSSENIHDFIQECLWVWDYIVVYRSSVLIHILLGVVGIVMVLMSSVASKVLIDSVIGFDSRMIVYGACLMVGMRIGSIVFKSVSSYLGAYINIKVQNELQHELYCRILKTDWQSLEEYRSGDLLQRISSDASAVAGGITSFLPSLISCIIQFAGAFLIILNTDPVMGLIGLIGVPFTGLCYAFLLRRMRRYNREMKEMYSDVVSFQQESLEKITTIKSFGVMDWYGAQMKEVHQKYRSKALRNSRFTVKTSALMSLVSLVSYMSCFGWGVYRLWQHQISYGEMTMFLQLSSLLQSAFSSMVSLVPSTISITVSARRIMNVVQLDEEDLNVPEGLDEEEALSVELQDVNFEYQGGEPVLKGASFEAKDGQLVCLTGSSGEGKTTLLRIVLGLVSATSGRAVLTGASGKSYPLSAATRHVFGYVPQGNQVFSGTIAENLRLANPNATDEELWDVLKIACAEGFVRKLGGLEHEVGGRDKRLSEGQAQRLAVARALLRKAPILLLDEATSALDRETESSMLKNLMESGRIKTCILVTHRESAKQICSSYYHIHDGVLMKESV